MKTPPVPMTSSGPSAGSRAMPRASSVPGEAVWHTSTLLVLGNAPDRAAVSRLMLPAGLGRVLTTSRNQIWPPGQAMEAPVLDPQGATEFLINRTAGTGAGSRVRPSQRGVLGRVPGVVPAAARGPAGPG
jgi:hypothetical protein